MAKNKGKKKASETAPTEAAPETTQSENVVTVTIDGVTSVITGSPSAAISATTTIPDGTITGSSAAVKPPKSYVVKIGQVMVGKGDLRKPGDKIAASELSPAQAKAFLADGTIAV